MLSLFGLLGATYTLYRALFRDREIKVFLFLLEDVWESWGPNGTKVTPNKAQQANDGSLGLLSKSITSSTLGTLIKFNVGQRWARERWALERWALERWPLERWVLV